MLTGSGKALCSDGVFREPGVSEATQSGRTLLYANKLSSKNTATGACAYPHRPQDRVQTRMPMRIMTRHGTIRSANDIFAKPPDAPLSKIETSWHEHQPTQMPSQPEPASKPVRFRDLTFAQLFPPIRSSEKRFVRSNTKTETPARRPSLVRKLSDSVKGVVRRCGSIERSRTPKISKNRAQRASPDRRGRLDAVMGAASVGNAEARPVSFEHHVGHEQRDFPTIVSAGSTGNYKKEMPLRRFASKKDSPGVAGGSPISKERSSTERVIRRKPGLSYLHDADNATPHARVVGDPDRGTVFGDFINAPQTPDAADEKVAIATSLPPLFMEGPYSRPNMVPEPLRVPSVRTAAQPVRKESIRKWVDPSTRSWMPPEPRSHHHRSRSTDRSAAQPSNWNDRTDPVEDIIDAYAAERGRVSAWLEKCALEGDTYSTIPWRVPSTHNAAARETFVDTFDRGSHMSFVAHRRQESAEDAVCDFDGFGKRLYDEYMKRQAAGKPGLLNEEGYEYV